MRNPSRMILVGFDAAMPYHVEKFVNEGKMPNVANLIENGVLAEAYPIPPCNTPTNWATIATGATTGTHGCTGFHVHLPGEPLDYGHRIEQRGRTFLSNICKAEYLWDIADNLGKRTLIINYLTGWPAKLENGVMIRGSGIPPYYVAPWMKYVSLPAEEEDLKRVSVVQFQKMDGHDLFPSKSPPIRASMKLESESIEGPYTIEAILVDTKGEGYDGTVIRDGKKLHNNGEVVRVGEWSSWIKKEFKVKDNWIPSRGEFFPEPNLEDARKIKSITGHFRVRLQRLSPDASQFELYRTRIFSTYGWVHPPELASELVSGNILTGDDASSTWEDYRLEASRMARIIKYIKDTHGWDLCFLHFHLMDSVNHRYLAWLYPKFPGYTEEKRKVALANFEAAYKLVDDFTGELISSCVDEKTLVIFVSDHAGLPCWKFIWIPNCLVRAGLLAYNWSPEEKCYLVDWSRTKAFPYTEPTYVWVNLKGRDPSGIVEPEEYEEVRDRIIDALMSLRDPETGKCPIHVALRKEDVAFLGQTGDRVGDVVYYLATGYTPFEQSKDYSIFAVSPEYMDGRDVRPATRLFSVHDWFLPNAKVDVFQDSAVLIMSGPGIRRGFKFAKPVMLTDVAPTVAQLLKIPTPAQSEGRILHEALE